MKKVVLMLMATVVFTLLFTACDKEAELTPQNNNPVEKLTPELLITNYNLIENPIISEPSLNAEFALIDDGTYEEELPSELNEKTGKLNCIRPFKDSLYFILTQLDLSPEQAKKIQFAMQEFHKCKMFNHALLHKHNQEIIMKANKERMIILEKLKKNEITKEQAEKKLKQLHLRIQEIMKNDPVRKKIMDNLNKCHQELIENIRLILTKEQWEKLMLYLKKQR